MIYGLPIDSLDRIEEYKKKYDKLYEEAYNAHLQATEIVKKAGGHTMSFTFLHRCNLYTRKITFINSDNEEKQMSMSCYGSGLGADLFFAIKILEILKENKMIIIISDEIEYIILRE